VILPYSVLADVYVSVQALSGELEASEDDKKRAKVVLGRVQRELRRAAAVEVAD